MPPTLYLFHPGRTLVRVIRLDQPSDITWTNRFIPVYEAENQTRLIRAILGPTDLTVLKPDEVLRLLDDYATPTRGSR